jgi:hypothetical protein
LIFIVDYSNIVLIFASDNNNRTTKKLEIMTIKAKKTQIEKTVAKLEKQLKELRLLNNKNKNNDKKAGEAYSNCSTIDTLQNLTSKLSQVNLIKE